MMLYAMLLAFVCRLGVPKGIAAVDADEEDIGTYHSGHGHSI